MALLLGVAVYARPGDYPPIPGWIFVSVNVVGHLVLQTMVLGGATLLRVALAPRCDIELEGRVLRIDNDSLTLSGDHQIVQGGALTVTQGSDALTVTGPSTVLSWLATELQKVQPDGAETDVPEALTASRLQHTKGLLNPS